MHLVSGRAHPRLARAIAEALGTELTPATLKTFSSGEVYCRYEASVRGDDVFVIQPISANEDEGLNVNDALMELMVLVDAAVGASARRVIAVVPWYGYSRQDKKSAAREPITARIVARMLESAGVSRVLTMDLHAGQIQGMFTCPVDHMTATPLFSEYFATLSDSMVVVAPDAGRVKFNKNLASRIGGTLAILDKERPAQQVSQVSHVIGSVEGKTAVILDDMIDTGGTLRSAAEAVRQAGATAVYAGATHGIFSGDAETKLKGADLDGIVVTDTIALRRGMAGLVHQLSCADLLARSIAEIERGGSVSRVFDGTNHIF